MWIGAGCLGMIVFGIIFYQGIKNDNDTIVTLAIIGFIITNFLGLFMDYRRRSKFAKSLDIEIDEILNKLDNFQYTQKFHSVNKETVIAIDETNRKICLMENKHADFNSVSIDFSKTFSKFEYSTKIFDYNDILQTEIIEDDVTINKTSRSGQLGGALVGGLLAGGVGAVIGGLGASTTSSSKVKSLKLQIVVNNTQKTFYRILFISFKEAVPKTNFQYKKALDDILHWHNILSYIIKIEDENKSKED